LSKSVKHLLHGLLGGSGGGGHSSHLHGALKGIITRARKEGIQVVTPGGSGGKGLKNVLRELGVAK
jgi:hypothetical protein